MQPDCVRQPAKSLLIPPEQHLARLAMEAIALVHQIFQRAKESEINTTHLWAPMAAMVSIDEFVWKSPHFEDLDWHEYIAYVSEWAKTAKWESDIQRVHQWQSLVFVETGELYEFGDTKDIGNAIYVYEFNEADKIVSLAVYLQRKPSLGL